MARLADKVIIVTGGMHGIGRAMANRFQAEGARVVVASRSAGHEVASSTSEVRIATDVTSVDSVKALVEQVIQEQGRIDGLVNNAGVQLEKTLEETSPEEWDWLMASNLRSVFLCSRAIIPVMKDQGSGVILNLGSYDGLVADPGLAAYCASKGAVHALTRAIAVDHGRHGIRCNAICPGWIRTEMMQAYLDSQNATEDAEACIIAQHPIGRLGTPEDIASLATWLVSDEAAFATGQLYVHDGGLTAHAPYFAS